MPDKRDKKKPQRVFSFYKLHKFHERTFSLNETLWSTERPKNLTSAKKSDDDDFTKHYCLEKYNIKFDYLKTVENAYVADPTRNPLDHFYWDLPSIFVSNKFDSFIDRKANLAIFDSSYKLSDKFLISINGLYSPRNKNVNDTILLEKFEINLDKIKSYKEKTGIWYTFGGKQPHTTSTGVFGHDVENSPIRIQIEQQGGVKTALVVKIYSQGGLYTVIISANGSITILNKTLFEEAYIIVRTIINELIL